jgi:hypothetical protein
VRITATFSDALREQIDGMAIGDEFYVRAKARIVSAEEALIEVSSLGDRDRRYLQGDLEVRLLLTHGVVESE